MTIRLIAMGKILVRPHQGRLRRLSPDLISKARDENATQVARLGLTFLGTAAFCLLSLLSPDADLLGGSKKINVPFAGPVSFSGFMLLGPTVLILLRVYLQIYVEHSARLERLARSFSAVRAPTLAPLQNSLIWLFGLSIFYVLLPVTILLFAWKAAVFPAWGLGLFGVAVAIIVSHVMLPFGPSSRRSKVLLSVWRSKVLLSGSAAMIAVVVVLGLGGLRRPFDLVQANLSGQWLVREDLCEAKLNFANLSHSYLIGANLGTANLFRANLRGANLAEA
jgi:Pentapeptide repeats (8 copies)